MGVGERKCARQRKRDVFLSYLATVGPASPITRNSTVYADQHLHKTSSVNNYLTLRLLGLSLCLIKSSGVSKNMLCKGSLSTYTNKS